MMIQSIQKGRTVKTVAVLDTANSTDQEVIYFAIIQARETPSSVFGKTISRDDDGNATVRLYTE